MSRLVSTEQSWSKLGFEARHSRGKQTIQINPTHEIPYDNWESVMEVTFSVLVILIAYTLL